MIKIQKKNKFLKILIITPAIILLLTHIVYAKYFSIDRASAEISIAKPVFIVDSKESTKISEINNIGYYEFSIKNYDEKDNISHVGFIYTIEIIANANDAIQFELYKGEDIVELINMTTAELYINGNEKVEQKYKLKVIYDNSKNIDGKEILEEVKVKVHSEQENI